MAALQTLKQLYEQQAVALYAVAETRWRIQGATRLLEKKRVAMHDVERTLESLQTQLVALQEEQSPHAATSDVGLQEEEALAGDATKDASPDDHVRGERRRI